MHKELEVMKPFAMDYGSGVRNSDIDLFTDTDKCAGCDTGEK